MPLLPQGQRLQPLEELESVERTHRRANVAEQLNSNFNDKCNVPQPREVPEDFPELQPVIARVRLGEFGELAIVPLELSAIDDHATDGSSVSANVLGGR